MSAAHALVGGLQYCLEAFRHNPLLELSLAVDWLDLYPRDPHHTDEGWDEYDVIDRRSDGMEFWEMRQILRAYLPAAHTEFVWAYWYSGMNNADLGDHMLYAINREIEWHAGDGLWELSQLPYVPIQWLGAGVYEEWYEEANRAAWIVKAMGALDDTDYVLSRRPRDWAYDCAHNASMQFDDADYAPATLLMQWLFSRSGNTVLDTTYEEAGENGIYPTWDEYPQIVEVCTEAIDSHSTAIRYLSLLEKDMQAFTEFCTNLVIAYATGIQKAFYSVESYIQPQFRWDAATRGSRRRKADPELRLLPAGDYPAAA